MNQAIFVGRLVAKPTLIPETNIGTFIINARHSDNTADDLMFYTSKQMLEQVPLAIGTAIGIKAHVKNNNNNLELHAEKVTFINAGVNDEG